MTDTERQQLIADLRVRGSRYCPEAADEIERLEAELKHWRDRCGKAEGAMLRIQGINSGVHPADN